MCSPRETPVRLSSPSSVHVGVNKNEMDWNNLPRSRFRFSSARIHVNISPVHRGRNGNGKRGGRPLKVLLVIFFWAETPSLCFSARDGGRGVCRCDFTGTEERCPGRKGREERSKTPRRPFEVYISAPEWHSGRISCQILVFHSFSRLFAEPTENSRGKRGDGVFLCRRYSPKSRRGLAVIRFARKGPIIIFTITPIITGVTTRTSTNSLYYPITLIDYMRKENEQTSRKGTQMKLVIGIVFAVIIFSLRLPIEIMLPLFGIIFAFEFVSAWATKRRMREPR